MPMPVSPAALDEWVTRMVLAGHEHGGCAFDGWTATLPPGAVNRCPLVLLCSGNVGRCDEFYAAAGWSRAAVT